MASSTAKHPVHSAAETVDPVWKRWTSIIAVGIVAFLGAWTAFSYIKGQKEKEIGDAWLGFSKFESGMPRGTEPAPGVEQVPENLKPWARLQIANRPLQSYSVQKQNLSEAKPLFEGVAKDAGTSPAALGMVPDLLGVKAVTSSIDALGSWEKSHTQLFENPAPAATERARFVTDAGTFEIAFYPDQAPEHVKNFRQLVKEGFYQKTKFHRISKAGIHIVQGGDPNSIDDSAKEKWGQGVHGDGILVEKNKLAHVRGAVAMAQPSMAAGEKKSSGCQFYIVTEPSHSLDGTYTVFGTIISGMETIDKISGGELEPNSERPKSPALITSTVIF